MGTTENFFLVTSSKYRKRVNTDQKQKATYQWNMAKELGVTTGTEHDRVIDRIRVMEKRDRTKAERLENKNIIP